MIIIYNIINFVEIFLIYSHTYQNCNILQTTGENLVKELSKLKLNMDNKDKTGQDIAETDIMKTLEVEF